MTRYYRKFYQGIQPSEGVEVRTAEPHITHFQEHMAGFQFGFRCIDNPHRTGLNYLNCLHNNNLTINPSISEAGGKEGLNLRHQLGLIRRLGIPNGT